MSAIEQCSREQLEIAKNPDETVVSPCWRYKQFAVVLRHGIWALLGAERRAFIYGGVCFVDLEDACAAMVELDTTPGIVLTPEACEGFPLLMDVVHKHRGVCMATARESPVYYLEHRKLLDLIVKLRDASKAIQERGQ